MVPFALSRSRCPLALLTVSDRIDSRVALRIVGVRDYRCYGIALLSAPFANSLGVGAISPLLAPRRRAPLALPRSAWIAAAALAAVVMLKLFLWPLVLWLAFTRRTRTAVLSVGLMAGVTLASWAVLGFAGFRDLLRTSSSILTHLRRGQGVLARRARALARCRDDASPRSALARRVPAARADRARGRHAGSDAWTFIVAIGAAFALSPIVWLHYFVLLYIPIAIVRPRLSWLWALPLAFWMCRGQSIDGASGTSCTLPATSRLHPASDRRRLIVFALSVATA